MYLLLHTIAIRIILAAPAGSNTARRASIAGSSVIMTQGTYPDCSSTGTSHNFLASNMLESGSTASVPATTTVTGSVTSIMPTAPTGTLLTAPTANDELSNTCTCRTFNIDATFPVEVYMVGIILAISFAGIMIALIIMCKKKFNSTTHSAVRAQELWLLGKMFSYLQPNTAV
ncbi:hypothetical protein EV702DRAFT_1042351 [Suillus placidus]|uniref:Uncharacterized protein n=1 Tax=Suillus placidus TaxID=48579 RepID=A0A9P7A2G9_9AGAM|nr:hypothetical protein EV702DRAFT_1042351 [Suillus placidus]